MEQPADCTKDPMYWLTLFVMATESKNYFRAAEVQAELVKLGYSISHNTKQSDDLADQDSGTIEAIA